MDQDDARTGDDLRVGARVITMQRPGLFTIVAREGRICDIQGDDGTRLRVLDAQLRTIVVPEADPPA